MLQYSKKYTEFFNGKYLMGPNCIQLLDELLIKYPIQLNRKNPVLDLGCGNGLTSMFLARETGATIYANDLWINAEDNLTRFKEWQVADCIIPCCEDANRLSYAPETFDAVFSVDAYHYFAGKEGFFQEKILPYVKKGGTILIAIPGIKDAFEGQQKSVLKDWLGEDADLFHGCEWWRQIIGLSNEMASVDVWQMENFSAAWESWLSVDNEFAIGDKAYYDSIIQPYTCFIGIAVQKR